jgi:alpha-beta hydrolase superfamily lysophospholipase
VKQEQARFAGVGGRQIFWQAWLPDASPRAIVVVAHGASEHSDRYAHVARRLVDDGFGVYAIEHRGHGRSDGPRALIDRVDNAVADLDRLVRIAAERDAAARVFLLGHSMGGAIAVRYAVLHGDRLSGLILSGPLAALEAAPPAQRVAARVLSTLTPRLPVVAIDATLVSRDPEVVRAYVGDPLVHHGKLPARTVAELAAAIDAFPDSVASIRVPTLIMYGTDDALCPPAGSLMLHERIGASDKTLKAYDGLHHEILNEPEQDQVMDDMCAWLGARVAVAA